MQTREDRLAYWREYHRRPERKAKKKAQQAKYRAAHPEVGRAANAAWYARRREYVLARQKAEKLAMRGRIIAGYGGRCACCGEARYTFLAIDHVNGGGKKDLDTNGSRSVMKRIIAEGFPADYRILCHNCNLSRGFYGFCPHDYPRSIESVS